MAAPPPTKLDANQVLKHSFDEANGRLRTDAVISGDIIVSEINISHTDDSIRLGDGVNLITATVDGPKVGLDVNVLNDIDIEISAADGDNIAISDGVDTLAVNADGSLNVNIVGTGDPNITNIFDSVSAVASGSLTTILVYTPISNVKLKNVTVSGTNMAEYEVLIDGNLVSKKRSSLTEFNLDFNFTNGVDVLAGDQILVRVLHNRPDIGDFESNILIAG